MPTLENKRQALKQLERHGGSCDWEDKIAREALRESIAREEAEEAAKKPTLTTICAELENCDCDEERDSHDRAKRIVQAVEKLAPHLRNDPTGSVMWEKDFRAFANSIASIVRLDP